MKGTKIRYIIASTPRSRSYWLSKTLSYQDEVCLHDPVADVDNLVDLPVCHGIVDTGVAFFYDQMRVLHQDAVWIVVKRNLDEVKRSLARIGVPTRAVDALAFFMKDIEKRAELVVPYDDLDKMAPDIWRVAGIREKFDPDWWSYMKQRNLEAPIEPALAERAIKELKKCLG